MNEVHYCIFALNHNAERSFKILYLFTVNDMNLAESHCNSHAIWKQGLKQDNLCQGFEFCKFNLRLFPLGEKTKTKINQTTIQIKKKKEKEIKVQKNAVRGKLNNKQTWIGIDLTHCQVLLVPRYLLPRSNNQ